MTTVDTEPIVEAGYAERALLGAVLVNDRVLDDVLDLVRPDDFYVPMHRVIWDVFLDMRTAGEAIDPVTALNRLASDPGFMRGPQSGALLLHTLSAEVPTAANAAYYADIVAETAARRRLVEAGQRVYQLGNAPGTQLDEVLALSQQALEGVERPNPRASTHIGDLLEPYLDDLDTPPAGVVHTPWPDLDEVLNGGLFQGELIVVAARPSVGKSIVGLNLARTAARAGVPTLVFALEMSKNQVLNRILADEGSIPLANLVRHELTGDDWAKAAVAAGAMHGWPLYIDDRTDISVADIAAASRRQAREGGLGLIVIDYLGLVRAADTRVNRQEQVARMSRELLKLGKELGVPVVVLQQLNRGPEQRMKSRPAMADLRETGQVEQDAHKILLLWRQEDRPGVLCVIVAKNRDGLVRDIDLSFSGHFARIRSDYVMQNMG